MKIPSEDIKWIIGIGVIVVPGIYKGVAWLLKRRRESKLSASKNPAEPSLAVNIDPRQIIKDIEESPLLHRPETARRYYGVRVDWTGRLYAMRKYRKKEVSLAITIFQEGKSYLRLASVSFDVNPAQYPGLNLLKNDAPVRVSGIIKEIELGMIFLRDAKLISYGSSNDSENPTGQESTHLR